MENEKKENGINGGRRALAFESKELIKRLQNVEVGELVTFEDMDRVAMGSTQSGGKKYCYLLTARKVLERTRNMCFKPEPNKGIRRMTDLEIIEDAKAVMGRQRRISARQMVRLSAVEYEHLDSEGRIEHNTAMSIHHALNASLKPGQIAGVRREITNANARLQIGETLDAFK